MSSTSDHIDLANQNHRALHFLLQKAEEFPEWVATIAFYKAVHVVEAVFSTEGRHSNNHDSRLDGLKLSKFEPIFKAYRPLYAASLVARYLADSSQTKEGGKPIPYRRFEDYMPADAVKKRLVKKRLKAVEDNAVKFLSEEQKVSLLRVES